MLSSVDDKTGNNAIFVVDDKTDNNTIFSR